MNINRLNGKRAEDPYARVRQKMVDRLRKKGIGDPRVLEAMMATPRHLFVEEVLQDRAYEDYPLPIGFGQTISQPFMVGLMTQILKPEKQHQVLEIGSGSGYQTAILAHLVKKIWAVERIPELVKRAQVRLAKLGINNVIMKAFDGTPGWGQFAPYQGILVAAGSPEIPRPLVDQLAVGGRLVIPIGDEKEQRLLCVIKGEKENKVEDHGGCVFVKLVGQYGWQDN